MSGRYLGILKCPRCSRHAPEAEATFGCKYCASEGFGVNLAPVYDLMPGTLPHSRNSTGIFTFRDLLPLLPDDKEVSLVEGGTPVLELDRLARHLGLDRLLLKDESRNPTWSYKDRLAAVAVSKAVAQGARTVAVSSTGNHGAAVAAYAAAAGLSCVVFTLASVPAQMSVLMRAYGACVVGYEKSHERWTVMRSAVDKLGWTAISGLVSPAIGSNPFGIEGYKTIAYELWQQLGRVPDVVIIPAAYGDGIAGVRRGFNDLIALGLASQMPRLVAIDPFGAYLRGLGSHGAEVPTVPTLPSMAFSVATPMATYQGIDAIRGTGGTAISEPSDDAIAAMQLKLASTEGLYVEGSSALPLLAAQRLAERGWLAADESVVVLSTSTGLKDPDASARHMLKMPVLEPTLTALEAVLPVGMR